MKTDHFERANRAAWDDLKAEVTRTHTALLALSTPFGAGAGERRPNVSVEAYYAALNDYADAYNTLAAARMLAGRGKRDAEPVDDRAITPA